MDQRTLDRMVTQQRGEIVARALFPDEYHDGSDCRAEHGRIGLPCGVCLARRAEWLERVAQVRKAVQLAFN